MRVEEVGDGRFVLADPVGRGTTGTLWRAWDRKHGRFCAVRPVRRTRGGGSRFELTDGLRLRQPHLLTPYAAVEDGGRVLLASQLVAGGSLRELLSANGPLAPSTVADLLDQLLAGLAALHAEGIAHHGVRAGAALLDATFGAAPRLWLAGFGSAAKDPDGFDEDLLAAGTVAAALLDEPATGRLAAVLDALRSQDPADRPTAVGAREALRVARPAAEPRTADGSRVVILDRLPSLPAGWSPDGPPERRLASVPSPPPGARGLRRRRTLEVVHSTDAAPDTPSFRPTRTLHAVTDPPADPLPTPRTPAAPVQAAPPAPAEPDAPAAAPAPAEPEPGPDPEALARAGAQARAAEEARAAQLAAREWLRTDWQTDDAEPGWRRYRPEHARWKGIRGPLLAAAAALVVLTGAGITAAVAGRDPAAPGSPAAPTRPPEPTGPAIAGGRCGWQQEGDTATVDATRLRCTRTPTGYSWLPA